MQRPMPGLLATIATLMTAGTLCAQTFEEKLPKTYEASGIRELITGTRQKLDASQEEFYQFADFEETGASALSFDDQRGGQRRGGQRGGQRGGGDRGGQRRGGPDRGGRGRDGHDRGGHDRGGHDRGGHDRGGYDRGGPRRDHGRHGDGRRGPDHRQPGQRHPHDDWGRWRGHHGWGGHSGPRGYGWGRGANGYPIWWGWSIWAPVYGSCINYYNNLYANCTQDAALDYNYCVQECSIFTDCRAQCDLTYNYARLGCQDERSRNQVLYCR